MSRESRLEETGTAAVPPTKLIAEGRDLFVLGSGERHGTKRNCDGKRHEGKMNYYNEDLDRCLWRRSTHHLRIPSQTDALSNCSSSSSHIRPATVAKMFSIDERSSASSSLPIQSKKAPAKTKFVTSVANEVMSISYNVGLTSSLTPILKGGKVLERTSRRQMEELSGRRGVVEKKEGGLEPSERDKRDIIDSEKGERVNTGERGEEHRQKMPLSVAENDENNKEKGSVNDVHVSNKGQSKQEIETDAERQTKEKEEEEKKERKKEEEEASKGEVSSTVMEFLDAVNDLAPEDKISQTLVREDQVNTNRNIGQPELSRTATMELSVPRPQKPRASNLPQPLSDAVPHYLLQRTAE